MFKTKYSSLRAAFFGLVISVTPGLLNAQQFDWDEPGNNSGFTDDAVVGTVTAPGGVRTGVLTNIDDTSDTYHVDINWLEEGTLTAFSYGDDFATWQDPNGGGDAQGAFGGNTTDGYIAVGWNNNLDTPEDGVATTFTFRDQASALEPLYGIRFSVYDVDEAEVGAPGAQPWDDVVRVIATQADGTVVNLTSAAGVTRTVGSCVRISNEPNPYGAGNAFEGVGAGADDSPTGCATRGVNTPGNSVESNIQFDIDDFAVRSFTIGYRTGNDIDNAGVSGDENPTGQRIGITNIEWPMINGHIYQDTDGSGGQNGAEPDLAGVDVFLCSSPVAASPCDPTDPEYLRTVTTDANGDWRGNTTAGDVVASIDTSTLPAGLDTANPTEGTVTSTSGATTGVNTFSENDGFTLFVAEADIGDQIFYDYNGNGIFDGADSGIPGVTVQLCHPSELADSADNFGAISYTNNDGSVDFAAPWDELGDDDSPAGGQIIYVSGGALQLDADGGGDPSIQREVDLSEVVGDVELSFDFTFAGPQGDYESSDEVDVFILNSPLLATGAPDGGTVIASTTIDADNFPLAGSPNSTGSTTLAFTSPQASVYIAYVVEQFNGDGEILQVDNVLVQSTDPVSQICETTTTDGAGNYTFADQPADDYTLTVDPLGTTLPLNNVDPVPTADPQGALDGVSTFTFDALADDLTQDFAYQPNAISGNVSEDQTGNGAGDANLAGVTVQLYSDTNADGVPDALLATTVTDANGNYEFNGIGGGIGLPTDDYVVVQIDSAGYNSVNDVDASLDGDIANVSPLDSQIPVSIASGEIDSDNNFIDSRPSLLQGVVYIDEDLDGINDIEETGITSVTVELLDSGNNVIATTVTDSNGNYSFEGVVPGDYTVRVLASSVPDDLTGTVGNIGTIPVSVAPGDIVRELDFGYIPDDPTEGAIGDRVWSDADGDGVQDPGESGIAGVVLSLQNADGTPALDSTSTPIPDVTTNANGDYLFTNIPLGSEYKVVVNQAASAAVLGGFTPTTGPQSVGGYVGPPVTLSPALTVVTDVDFGFNNPDHDNDLTDTVWFDEDGDGVRDAGEPGIAGITVDLYKDSNNDGTPDLDVNGQPQVVATATTDANGEVNFPGLEDGTYIFGVTDNASELTQLNPTTSEAVATLSTQVTVAGGASLTDASFGYNNPGLISGTVYVDDAPTNSDQDPGEAGYRGVTVTLLQDTDNNGSYETTVTTDVTDSAGDYSFDGLPPGDYRVVISTPPTGGIETEDPDVILDNQTDVDLAVGESSVENDFGYTNPSNVFDISGTVFLDTDKDGVEDAGEDGIPSISLDLIDRDSIETYNIINGRVDYNKDGVISAADNGVVNGIQLIAGEFDMDGSTTISLADDGVVGPFTITDGVVDSAPALIRASSDGVIATIATDANGDYEFTGLPAGNYSVAVTDSGSLLAGYDITSGLDVLNATIVAADVTDVDFGYSKDEGTGSISGEVWIDEDRDDLAQDDEVDLPGVRVYLCSSPITPGGDAPCDPTDDEFLQETVTDNNGEYIFTGLPPLEYVVATEPSDIPADLTETVTPGPISVSEGEDVTEVDVGHQPDANTGVLAGFVWTDVNSNGLYDPGEAPIEGVVVNVVIASQATPADPNPVFLTTTTGPDGRWMITGIDNTANPVDGMPNLRDGYLVGYTEASVPTNLETDQPTNMPLGDIEYFPVDLASDEDNMISNLDFAFPPLPATELGTISGTIYSDLDPNPANLGSYSEAIDGELGGVSVDLVHLATGNVIATVLTDENGFYEFTGLPDATYQVNVTDTANVTKDLNANETITNPILISALDRTSTDNNAGFVSDTELQSIGSKFFFDTNGDGNLDEGEDTNRNGTLDPGEDLNGNGFLDPGEPGVPGMTIQCWLDNDLSETPEDPTIDASAVTPQPGVDNLIRTVVTDKDGEYYCTSLPAGQYIVVVKDSGNYQASDAVPDTGSIADGEAKNWSYALTLTDNTANYAADFAVAGTNTVSGSVAIEDENLVEPVLDDGDLVVLATELDGVVGGVSADSPAEGVSVRLLVLQNGEYVPFSSTTTDAAGEYEFDRVPDGTYVVEVLPQGSVISGYGQTGDPSLVANMNGNGTEDLVCDTPTRNLCDNRSGDGSAGDQAPIVLSGPNDSATGVDFLYQQGFVTTPVTMSFFKSSKSGNTVTFDWETANEVGNAGFQLYARGADGWELISDFIVSLNDDTYTVNSYTYEASGVDATWFSLVAVSTQEELTAHGPFKLGEYYGEQFEAPSEFDWSGIDRKQSTKTEVSDSVRERLQRALQEQPDAFQ